MMLLLTGGVGFLGSHLGNRLAEEGHEVFSLDAFVPEVHPRNQPNYELHDSVTSRIGDIRKSHYHGIIQEADVIYHYASLVSVFRSMQEIHRFADHNCMGTASLLESIIARKKPLTRLIVAASCSQYGEGEYRCSQHKAHTSFLRRPRGQLDDQVWDAFCPVCHWELIPQATRESHRMDPESVYSITKECSEKMCLSVGRIYDIPVVSLRFFNVYGAYQALHNPYTAVLAIFLSLMLKGEAPNIFEDGLQKRDFVHVDDVVDASILALDNDAAVGESFNIGSDTGTALMDAVNILRKHTNFPEVIASNEYRNGDIRHLFGSIGKANKVLGYSPKVSLESGLKAMCEWGLSERGES